MQNKLSAKRDHFIQLVQSQKESCTPINIFCKSHNLPQSTFYYWRNKLNALQEKKERSQSTRFIPLSVSPSSLNQEEGNEAASISISFPSGVTLKIKGKDSFALSMCSCILGSGKIQ